MRRSSSVSKPSTLHVGRASSSRNRSSIGSRLSQSSILLRGSSLEPERRQATQPLAEKSYHTHCVHKLTEFLTKNFYPHPLSQKMLFNPSQKSVFQLFEFLYGFLAPGFKLSSKPEEEVVSILKHLLYPFSLKKVSLQNPGGGRHTWGALLAMLVWLMEVAKQQQILLEPAVDAEDGFNIFHEAVATHSAEGKDDRDLEEFLKRFVGVDELQKKEAEIYEDIHQLERKQRDMDLQEIELLHQLDMKKGIETDNINLRNYIIKMRDYLPKKQLENDELSMEVNQQMSAMQNMKEEIEQLKNIGSEQKEKGQSNPQLLAQRKEVADRYNQEEAQFNKMQQQLWDLEMQLSFQNRKVAERCYEANNTFNSLRAGIPEEFAPLKEFEARLPGCSVESIAEANSLLSALHQNRKKEVMVLEEKHLKRAEYLMEMQIELKAFDQVKTEYEEKIEDACQQHEELKTRMQKECQMLQAEDEVVSSELNRLRQSGSDVDQIRHSIAKLEKELEALNDEIVRKEETTKRNIQEKEAERDEYIASWEERVREGQENIKMWLKKLENETEDEDEIFQEDLKHFKEHIFSLFD